MLNRLYFNPREWNFNKACTKNVGERCFINGIDGKLVEIYSIGNWQWDLTEIVSKPLILEKQTEYHFCFWLNGGENDRNDEICQLKVFFDGDDDKDLLFKLNRGFITPLKRYCGWELYDISFQTGNSDFTQLKFVARSAYTAIQPAKDPEEYADLEDVLDEFHEMRPQRHNLIFEDGWPANNWYSTKELRKKRDFESKSTSNPHNNSEKFRSQSQNRKKSGFINITNLGKAMEDEDLLHPDLVQVMEDIKNDLDVDAIISEVKSSIDIHAIADDIKKAINLDSIFKEMKQTIMDEIRSES